MTPTSATPFSLIYDREAIIPLEIEIPSLRVTLHDVLLDEDYKVAYLE